MKAIVMAGGEGTRLRPLTSGKPKPMVSLFDRPILEHTVGLLKKNGIEDICFTLGYLPAVIKDHFGDGSAFGVRIEYRTEKTPLGTAGGVRACADFARGDDVLVISGDAVCDFDLKKCIRAYKSRPCAAALLLYEHDEPTEYGLAVTDGEGMIERFIEKPDWGSVVTNRINTGIYILPPETVALIPSEGEYDFGRDLFPKMLGAGLPLYGILAEGYWCDVGSPEAYRRCCADILGGKTKITLTAPQKRKGVWSESFIPEGCETVPPVYIGKNCTLEEGAVIGPHTVIGEGSSVAAHARVRGSVLHGVTVGAGAAVEGAVICADTSVGERAEIETGCVIGERCVIGRGCLVVQGVYLWPANKLSDGKRITQSITESSSGGGLVFGTDHILRGKMPFPFTQEAAVGIGSALSGMKNTGISFVGGEAASVLAEAIGCGVRGGGGECVMTDSSFEAEASFAAELYGLGSSVFVRQQGSDALVSVFAAGGVRAGRAVERKIEAAASGERKRAAVGAVGQLTKTEGTARAYIAAAVRDAAGAGSAPTGLRVSVTGHGAANRALRTALAEFGCELTERRSGVPEFCADEGGLSLVAEDEKGTVVNAGHMLALTLLSAVSAGTKTLSVPLGAPDALDLIAARYGAKLLRCGRDGAHSEYLYLRQRFMRDGIFAALRICSLMAERRASLRELTEMLPEFATAERDVQLTQGRAFVMRELAAACAEMSAELTEGLTLRSEKGSVRVAPCADASAVRLYGEAKTAEMAEELCIDIERRIAGLS